MAISAPFKSLRKTRRQTQTTFAAHFRMSKPFSTTANNKELKFRQQKKCTDLDLDRPTKVTKQRFFVPPAPTYSPLTAALDVEVSPSFEIDFDIDGEGQDQATLVPSLICPSFKSEVYPYWMFENQEDSYSKSIPVFSLRGRSVRESEIVGQAQDGDTSPDSNSSPVFSPPGKSVHENVYENQDQAEMSLLANKVRPVHSQIYTMYTANFSPNGSNSPPPFSTSSVQSVKEKEEHLDQDEVLTQDSTSLSPTSSDMSSLYLGDSSPLDKRTSSSLHVCSKRISPAYYNSNRVSKKKKKALCRNNEDFCSLQKLARVGGLRFLPEKEENTAKHYMTVHLTEKIDLLATRAEENGVNIVTLADVMAVLRTLPRATRGFGLN